MENTNFEPSVLKKTYQFYLNIINCLNNFPKKKRYTLGEKIDNNVLALIEIISLANVQIRTMREPIVHNASAKCELIKILIRVSFDLSLINNHQYLDLEKQIQEIGRMIGGWIKFLRAQ